MGESIPFIVCITDFWQAVHSDGYFEKHLMHFNNILWEKLQIFMENPMQGFRVSLSKTVHNSMEQK